MNKKGKYETASWDRLEFGDGCAGVINLSGRNVLDPTGGPGFNRESKFAKTLRDSRVGTNTLINTAIANCYGTVRRSAPPPVFITASGVGYYPTDTTMTYTENYQQTEHDRAMNYWCKFTTDWENAALTNHPKDDTRRAAVRLGVVLGWGGWYTTPLVRLCRRMGLPLITGKGTQPFPWIHISDAAALFVHLLENPGLIGAFNGVAPDLVTMEKLITDVTSAYKPLIRFPPIRTPEQIFKWAFGDDRALMLLTGAKIQPERTLSSGFLFRYPTLQAAITDLRDKELRRYVGADDK